MRQRATTAAVLAACLALFAPIKYMPLTRDGVVWASLGGQVVRAGNTGASKNVGSELDLLVRYQLDRHQTIIGGCSHFWPGSFIEQGGSHERVDLAYLIWQLTF